MKKLTLALIAATNCAIAQTNTMSIKRTVEIEIDPIAYAMKGYSVHGIYNHHRLRFDLGVFGIEQPGNITGNTNFTTMTRGFGLKTNYLITGVKGLYAGIDAGYAANNVTQKESEINDVGHNLSFGAHMGYRIFPFSKTGNTLSHFYITPWAGISYNQVYDAVNLSGYKEGNIGYFATFHIGYRL